MKRLFKAILKVVVFLFVIIVVNFILDLITGLAPWILQILSVLAIIALIVIYYLQDKQKEDK